MARRARLRPADPRRGPGRFLLTQAEAQGQRRRRPHPLHRQHALHQHHPRRPPAALSRQPRDRAPHQEPRPLERDGDGRPANKNDGTLGGHIATFASSATLYEIGFNHFFRGPDHPDGADHGLFPGPRLARHLRPRLPRRPARASSSWRTSAASWQPGGGLSSLSASLADARLLAVPHRVDGPRADHGHLPGPLQPLPGAPRPEEDRPASTSGASSATARCDEPETLGALTLASREKLDNLIFVVNCNLQRLDGPVRGNGKIIQELEAAFRGAGWNVHQGHLGQRLGPAAGSATRPACSSSAWARSWTANIQKYTVEPAAPTSASTSSASIPSCSSWSST